MQIDQKRLVMRIVLLGATGFVGKNVSKILSKNQDISLIETSKSLGLDLLDKDKTFEFLKIHQPDYVVNCAAVVGSLNYVTKYAADIIRINSIMIINMYDAVSKLEKKPIIINPIANCAYPADSRTFKEDEWWDGHLHRSVLAYGSTRRLLWSTGESYFMQHNIESYYLLVPNMYGPFDSTNPDKAHALNALISKFVKAEKEKKDIIEVWGTGIAIREWLYAEDFGRVINKILNKEIETGLAEPINIGQNYGLSVKELTSIINKHFDNKFNIEWNSSMPDGAHRKVMDDTKFNKVFKNFIFTPFEEGIIQTINYYKLIYPY